VAAALIGLARNKRLRLHASFTSCVYHLRQARPKSALMISIAKLPAWNRAGVKPVGVFDVMIGPDAPTKYVLLPFKSLEATATAQES
jgi:hypothetical protein